MLNTVIRKNRFVSKLYRNIHWREIVALLVLLLAVVFFRSERKELLTIIPKLKQASMIWLLAGVLVTGLFLTLEAGMYKKCFSSIGLNLSWKEALILFLKRNFVSVFLPAGGVSTLAYNPAEIRKLKFNQSHVYQAGGLFGFAGLASVFIAGLPVVVLTVMNTGKFMNSWIGLAIVLILISLVHFSVQAIRPGGRLSQWTERKFPSVATTLEEILHTSVNKRQFSMAILFSVGVELCGMLHVYIAMLALGIPASIPAAAAGYVISVLMMVISPFLRGLGAVELAMVAVLEQFGYGSVQALSITLLYRAFEFWMPLLAGLTAYCWKGRKIFLRIMPALFTFLLGLISIISVVTPPLYHRLHLVREFVPLGAIHATNMLVLLTGFALVITSSFLIRGLRNAWLIAVALSLVSFLGHIIKALDYEESILSLVSVAILLATVRQYRIRSSRKWMNIGLKTVFIVFFSFIAFGFISFYYIDKRHFGVDFTWQQSLLHTVKSFLLTEDDSLRPITRFGKEFIWLVRCVGFMTWGFLIMSLFIRHRPTLSVNENAREKAQFVLNQYGSSSNDYFKISRDKLIFLSGLYDAFVAYRIVGGFAIVLEEPVCAAEHKVEVLREFDLHSRKMGLKSAYYRVDENSIPWFNQLQKQKILIGQEAILDVNQFSLEGKEKKALRNGLSSLQRKGYTTHIYRAPHGPRLVARLKKVSDDWLEENTVRESTFSQGRFDENEILNQDIITLENENRVLLAFLNIIPDYAENDCTYDLIRKANDAPGATMDALITKLVEYAKEHKKLYINLGLVPMTGIHHPENIAEQMLKLASEKVRRFRHYRGLREFKEKYAAFWANKYLVYENDFDLLQLPLAINTVMKW